MSLITGLQARYRLRRSTIFRDTRQTFRGGERSDKEAILAPGRSAGERSIAQRNRRAALDGHLPQFSRRGEAYPRSIGRKEDGLYSLRAGERHRLSLIQPPGTDARFPTTRNARECDTSTVGRNAKGMLTAIGVERGFRSEIDSQPDERLQRGFVRWPQ